MEFGPIKVEVEAGIALVTIERPEALNALNEAVLEGLDAAFSHLEKDAALRAVILTGSGKAFVAGADIKAMASLDAAGAQAFARRGQGVMDAIETFPRPVLAAVNGFALGGGCELALACDLRIASEKAKAGQPEVSLGVTPGFGGTQRLPRLVGRSRAKYLLFTGEVIDAAKALALGFFDEVVPAEELLPRCREIANLIAAKGPQAVSECKRLVDEGADLPLTQALALEAERFGSCFTTADQKEGMAAFIEKRSAHFRGR